MYYEPFNVPLDDYEGYIGRREYWDDLGTEWGWSPIEQKIIRLAGFVQQGGNLKKVINHYAKDRDEEYRSRIQYCIMDYILKLMTGDLVHRHSDLPFVDRIKRLTKEELVKLLSDQLKTSVRKTYYMEHGSIKEGWEIKYDNPKTPDDLLDKIDRQHRRKYPDETFYEWYHRPEKWWSHKQYLW